MCEAITEDIIAEVVTREEILMYDDPSLNDIKKYTVEELYARLEEELNNIPAVFSADIPLHQRKVIFLYLSELYRRSVPWPEILDWWEYDVIRCECPSYRCELTALIERVDQFTVTKIMKPDDIRDQSGCCVRCHTKGSMLSKEASKRLHEKTVSSQLHEVLYYVKSFVKMELERLRKIKRIQLESI